MQEVTMSNGNTQVNILQVAEDVFNITLTREDRPAITRAIHTNDIDWQLEALLAQGYTVVE